MGVSIPNIAFVEGDPVAFENFANLLLVAKFLMMLCLVEDIGRDRFQAFRHSDRPPPYHRPERRSPLSGRVALNVYPGLKHLG